MPKLDSLFSSGEQQVVHPLLELLAATSPDNVCVETVRPRELLGYKPARLFVHITANGKLVPPQEYSWDDDLNVALVGRGCRAVSTDNEKTRFALVLRNRLRRVETRFGDGFFNAVLVKLIKDSPLSGFKDVAEVMSDVFANEPHMGGPGFEDCSTAIQQVLRQSARELTDALRYDREEAEEILAGAVARYLDERFTVTDRRRLGWT